MGASAGTGEVLAWAIASDVPSTSPSHGSNRMEHMGSHGVRAHSVLTDVHCLYTALTDDKCNTTHKPRPTTGEGFSLQRVGVRYGNSYIGKR